MLDKLIKQINKIKADHINNKIYLIWVKFCQERNFPVYSLNEIVKAKLSEKNHLNSNLTTGWIPGPINETASKKNDVDKKDKQQAHESDKRYKSWKTTALIGMFLIVGLIVLTIVYANEASENNLKYLRMYNNYNVIDDEYDQLKRNYDHLLREKNSLSDSLSFIKTSMGTKQDALKKLNYYTYPAVGKTDWECNGSYNDGFKLYFDTYLPITIKEVTVYANNNCTADVVLYDNALKKKYTKEINFKKGKQTLQLNFDVETGKQHYLTCDGCELYRNTTCADYPYTLHGIISITGSSYKDEGYYYYFYNWIVSLNL